MTLQSRGISAAKAIEAEQRRVEQMLDRDRAEAAREQFRDEARQRFENGDSASSADAVIPPTEEWLSHGDVEGYTPQQDKHSTRVVKTVRRRPTPQAQKMMLAGRIGYEGLRACIWYAELFENTGHSGNIPSIDYGREVLSAPHDRLVFTERQLEAQDLLRAVRGMINPRFLAILDAMVLDDKPYYLAARAAQVRVGRAPAFFGLAVDDLCKAREELER
jgi:hypothetical protein